MSKKEELVEKLKGFYDKNSAELARYKRWKALMDEMVEAGFTMQQAKFLIGLLNNYLPLVD